MEYTRNKGADFFCVVWNVFQKRGLAVSPIQLASSRMLRQAENNLEPLPYPAYESPMPIHLLPVSRRAFLRQAMLTGAGLALTPHLSAAMRRTDANSWALLADTHIAADPRSEERRVGKECA